jgi:hypothetical protein
MEVIDVGKRKWLVVATDKARSMAWSAAQHFHKAGTELALTPRVGTHVQEGSSFEPLTTGERGLNERLGLGVKKQHQRGRSCETALIVEEDSMR